MIDTTEMLITVVFNDVNRKILSRYFITLRRPCKMNDMDYWGADHSSV